LNTLLGIIIADNAASSSPSSGAFQSRENSLSSPLFRTGIHESSPIFMGSHSHGAPVGTHSLQVAGNSYGKYPHPHATDPHHARLHSVQIDLHGRSRSLACSLLPRPIKIRWLEFICFMLYDDTCNGPYISYRHVRKFRRINSSTRRLSDSRGSPPIYGTETCAITNKSHTLI